MKLLLYLFDVATNKDAKINGNFRRTPLVSWVYGQTFLAIVTGRPTVLRFKDCDAWVESPGVPQARTGFWGDTADLADRLVVGDDDLGFVLQRDPKILGADAYRVSEADVSQTDLARLREALRTVSIDHLLEPTHAASLHETLRAWALE